MKKLVELNDVFFAPRQQILLKSTIPAALRRCEETGRFEAFKLNWQPGKPVPHVYWDSDVAKVVEGMAETLQIFDAPELGKRLEELATLITSAQQPDGYLNTHFSVAEKDLRFKNLFNNHELYCAGHLAEAAVAHYESTGKTYFLDAVCRYMDYIGKEFGAEAGKRRGYPGHEEIELALVKLYRATGKKSYLKLAKYFIDERGQNPNYFLTAEDTKLTGAVAETLINRQAHLPIREQHEAVGHAVRALYLYSGMADVAFETQDTELFKTCERLFDDIVNHKMYITGGVGSSRFGEAFMESYALPNAEAYAESCASMALVFFAKRMLDYTGLSKYAEVMEQTLYNGALSGLSLSGDKFFYVNALEVSSDFQEIGHIQKERQKWFSCSCCPTSFCRFLPQIGDFAFRVKKDMLFVDIPVAAKIKTADYALRLEGNYPYGGKVKIVIEKSAEFTLFIRIAGNNLKPDVRLNRQKFRYEIQDKYLKIKRNWTKGEVLSLELALEPELIYCNPAVPANSGRAAVKYGPLVYCAESSDNGVEAIALLTLSEAPDFKLKKSPEAPGGAPFITVSGYAAEAESGLYLNHPPRVKSRRLKLVPYAFWQNRGPSEMRVFLPVCKKLNNNI